MPKHKMEIGTVKNCTWICLCYSPANAANAVIKISCTFAAVHPFKGYLNGLNLASQVPDALFNQLSNQMCFLFHVRKFQFPKKFLKIFPVLSIMRGALNVLHWKYDPNNWLAIEQQITFFVPSGLPSCSSSYNTVDHRKNYKLKKTVSSFALLLRVHYLSQEL